MKPEVTFRSALEVSAEAQAQLVSDAFADYLAGPVKLDSVAAFGEFVRLQGIDLGMSRLALMEGSLIACAYVGSMGELIRVGGMGVVPACRRRGIASTLLSRLMEEAKNRGYRQMTLEVIAHNEAALKLYRRAGLEIVGKLIGYRRDADWSAMEGDGTEAPPVEEISLFEASRLLCMANAALWPYQLSGWAVHKCNPRDTAAWRSGSSIVVHSRPTASSPLRIRAFADMDGNEGHLQRVMGCLRQRFQRYPWKVSAVVPERVGANLFLPLGFEQEEVFQWQMASRLGEM